MSSESEKETTEPGLQFNDESSEPKLSGSAGDSSPGDVDNSPLREVGSEEVIGTEGKNGIPEETALEENEQAFTETDQKIQRTEEQEALPKQHTTVNGHDITPSAQDSAEEIYEHTIGSVNPTSVPENHEVDVEIEAQPSFLGDDLKLSSGGDDALGTDELSNDHSTAPQEEDGQTKDAQIRDRENFPDVSYEENTEQSVVQPISAEDHSQKGLGELDTFEDILNGNEEAPALTMDLFATEDNDAFDGRPDPESQGYSLLRDEEVEIQDQWESEGANTSADVQDVENGDDEPPPEFLSMAFPQEDGISNDPFAAFAQIQGSNSESAVALEFVAHQIVDPSNPVPQDMEPQQSEEEERQLESLEKDDICGSVGNDELFDFESGSKNPGEFDDEFDPTNKISQELLKDSNSLTDDPFVEIYTSNGQEAHENILKDEVEQPKTTELFGDDNFDELFPPSHQGESSVSQGEGFLSSAAPVVSSLFPEAAPASNLFKDTEDFLVSTPETNPIEPQVSHDVQPTVSSDAAPALQETGEDDLLDDLDDSEFMAAFGVTSEAKEQPATSIAPVMPSVPVQQNRYLPPTPKPISQSPYAPQSAPLTQPTSFVPQVSNQPVTGRTTSNRYAPTTTAPTSASINTQQPFQQSSQSPQIQSTYPGRPQVAVSSPPSVATRPAVASTSSFVTAKGGYSSPYDLPPQIAPKPKRHLPAPIPTFQRPGVPVAPLSANLYPPPPPSGPPPRSASTQPHFPAHNFPTSRVEGPGQSIYIPPNVPSLQNPVSPYQGQGSSVPPRTISPLVPQPPRTNQSQQSKAYAPPSTASPPNTRIPGAHQRQSSLPGRVMSPPNQMSSLPPQYQGGVGYPQSAHVTSPPKQIPPPANRYTPEPGAAPQRSVQYQQQARVASPPMPAPPTNRYTPDLGVAPQRGVHVHHPQQPPVPQRGQVAPPPMQAPPPNRYTSEPGRAPQMGYTTQPQQPQQPAQSSWEQTHPNYRVPQLGGPQIASTSFHDQGLDTYDHVHSEGMHPPSNSTAFAHPPSQISPSQYQHISQLQQYPGIQENNYATSSNTFEENPHSDLPPHFEMMEDADSIYRPEGIMPDRNIQKTPEPIHPIQQDDVSPPRPWERAALAEQQYRSPPKLPSFSQYDSAPLPPAQARTERQRSISPAVVRATPRSSMDLPNDRSQSYPSRKPPPHLRYASSSAASMTPEEDFQLRRGGCPIVRFGFGGKLITMIPRTPHRVNIRNTAPLMVPGPIMFTKLRDVVDPPGLASSFPGPLFSGTKPINAKSKDLANWLENNLAMLEQMRESPNVNEDDIIWIEDRKVLMKLIKVLVENNGVLHGSPEVDKRVKDVLLPQAASLSSGDDSESFGVTASALALSSMTQSSADPTAIATYNLTADFLRSIRSLLMQGDRLGAIRKAMDQKMWGHALLIASSVSEVAWRETAQQFIQSELRGSGSQEFDSLRFLYGIFGGEGLNAINELLPPTNRMISSIQSSATSSVPKFNSWKESLGMALLNRGSMTDHSAPLGLGVSLVSNGRIDAGHACFLLSMPSARFSAADLPETNFTLVGADQHSSRANYVGLPQILLSEIFEYTQCQSKQIPIGFLHLLPYKLWYAWSLADYGYPEIAEKYCESIGAFLQKESRGSIFITAVLIEVLKDLTERISQGSKSSFTEKSSWFGKKTARGDNFWKALETNLTKFVAGGEEAGDPSIGQEPPSQPEAQDPRFGRIASETSINRMLSMPNLRNQATTPVYGTFAHEVPRPPGVHSRYNTGGSESRYNPTTRYEQVSDFPGRGISTPDLDLGETSSYQPYSPPSEYQPYVPPPEPVQPPERHESPKADDEPVRERQESGKSDKSSTEKDKEKKEGAENKGSGWFGGWFKRGAAEPAPGVPGKPIKAKLGEESSFYYDKDLKKWVNKKDGNAPAKTAPPPPPPKRPSNLTSINSTPVPTPEIASPSIMPPPRTPTTQAPAPMPTTPSLRSDSASQPTALPPSRPTSALQPKPAAQKLDPLEALLSTRPASGARGAKKPARSRYVDVMNKK